MVKNVELLVNQRVIDLFAEKKIRQIDFCNSTGYSEKNLSNLLRGTVKKTSPEFFVAFAKFFPEVNLRWLFLGEGKKYLTTEEVARARDVLPDERTKLMAIIGEKDVELKGNQERVKMAYEALMGVAKIVEALPIMQDNNMEWEHLKIAMHNALRKLSS